VAERCREVAALDDGPRRRVDVEPRSTGADRVEPRLLRASTTSYASRISPSSSPVARRRG
jgi:hypothetical protein